MRSDKIAKTAAAGDWYNVLDPEFHLYLRETRLQLRMGRQRARMISVEFFDRDGTPVASFFAAHERTTPQP
ncbi:hypothetical protein [Undibacterium sp.]|uniref:hypothetical protein n=1 Tax=Undibacterium sp. TaxID=1914977 RepID=UPI00374D4F80